MSDKINLYLHGELGSIADQLSGDDPERLDTVDTSALLTNICRRVDRLHDWSNSEITRLEDQIQRLNERIDD